MTACRLLVSNAATAALFAALPPCLDHLGTMLLWLALFSGWAVAMLWRLIEADHIETRLSPPWPRELRFIGATERRAGTSNKAEDCQ